MLNHPIDHNPSIAIPHQNSRADRTIGYDEQSYNTSTITMIDYS
ncbi:hypothetical protein [Bartonella sp. B1099]|nr:hypothetical protein [Bartonella sp. B1099]